MLRTRLAVGLAVGMALSTTMVAQKPAAKNAGLDPRIVSALKDVSAARVKATIEKLVSFGTRDTLSANDPEMAKQGRGVIAAREWIKSEYERYSQAWRGWMGVAVLGIQHAPGGRRG